MTRTELPWLFYGRRIRPFSFALSFATASVAWLILSGRTSFSSLDTNPFLLSVGLLAVAATTLLWVGFWADSDNLMQHGLVAATGVWVARSVIIVVNDGLTQPGLLSACWAMAAAGAFFLEATTGEHRRR